MSTQILALLVVFVAFFQIGCSDDKPKNPTQVQAAANACMFDPSGDCQKRMKMMMENPQLAPQINAVAASALKNGGTGGVQVVTDSSGNKTVVPTLPQSIQQQAQKVKAALEADSNNPRSLYYDPPQPSRVVDRTPASNVVVTDSSGSSAVAPASVSSSGGGEVTR